MVVACYRQRRRGLSSGMIDNVVGMRRVRDDTSVSFVFSGRRVSLRDSRDGRTRRRRRQVVHEGHLFLWWVTKIKSRNRKKKNITNEYAENVNRTIPIIMLILYYCVVIKVRQSKLGCARNPAVVGI